MNYYAHEGWLMKIMSRTNKLRNEIAMHPELEENERTALIIPLDQVVYLIAEKLAGDTDTIGGKTE